MNELNYDYQHIKEKLVCELGRSVTPQEVVDEIIKRILRIIEGPSKVRGKTDYIDGLAAPYSIPKILNPTFYV